MSIRVNLLKPSEARRQGLVGVKFAIHVFIGTAASILCIVGTLTYIRYETASKDLEAARNIWEIREPMYNRLLKMKEDLATEKKFQQELRGWQASRIEWTPLLDELRAICPPTVQLRRLGIRGEFTIKKSPVVAPAEGEEGTVKPAAPSLGMATRSYTITIEGKAAGAMAEGVVVQFVRVFGTNPLFAPLFESPPELNSLQRDMARDNEQPIRNFNIGGVTKKREMREPRAEKTL